MSVTGFSLRRDVRKEVRESGYSVVGAAEFEISPRLRSSWDAFRNFWEDLPADEYLTDGGRYRYRRFDRVSFQPGTGEIRHLPHTFFFQSRSMNRFAGGMNREFAPLDPRALDSSFLRELIRFDFERFDIHEALLDCPWQVDIHQIRVVAGPGETVAPAPEGRHRDGFRMMNIHLVGRTNVAGGEFLVYDNAERLLKKALFTEPLDTVYADDTQVMHDVTAIASEDRSRPAVRDILVLGYDLLKGEVEIPSME